MSDPVTLSYLKGDITFEDYQNIIENEQIQAESSQNLVASSLSIDKSADKPGTSKEHNDDDTELEFEDYLDSESDEEITKWKDFDIETLNFDRFIEKTDDNSTVTCKKSSSMSIIRKRKKEINSEEDLAELKIKRRRNRVLPQEIQGLMGEANLAFARGEKNKAIDICLEVIKNAPNASEPYQLLSLLYSEIGDTEKALKVGLISAQLNKDQDEWIQLIQQALIEGNEELILFCYNHAIQCNPFNIDLHLARIKFIEEKQDTKNLVLAKIMLLKYLDVNSQSELYERIFKETLNSLSDETDKSKKIFVLKNDMKKFKENFAVEKLTLLIRLMIDQKLYRESIIIMMDQSSIRVANTSLALDFDNINKYEFAVPLLCDQYVLTLFIVCLISLDYTSEDPLIEQLKENETENSALYYLLIAEKYYEKHKNKEARIFYELVLKKFSNFPLKCEYWIKYGNCCKNLNNISEAINAYRQAFKLDNSNSEAAVCLVELLKEKEVFDEASLVIRTALKHEKAKNIMNEEIIKLMVNECLIEYEQQKYDDFLENARMLLFGNILNVLEPQNVKALLSSETRAQRTMVFHQLLEEKDIKLDFGFSKLDFNLKNDIFEVFKKICEYLVKNKRHDELMNYTVAGTVLPLIYDRGDWVKSINFSCLIACILKNDGKNGFNILKDFITEFRNANKLWSYVCVVIGFYPSLNQQKFFIRLSAKYMDHLPLCLINAHFAIMSGTYRYALVEYMNCFKQNPTDPFINLIIAITYCHISCQKYNTKRHLLVSQSLIFLKRYMEYRGPCQESYYNAARIMHQLSIFDLAVYYYKKCLNESCSFQDKKEIYDMKRIAAYNLILIYKTSGSDTLVRRVMKDYLTI